MAQVFHTYGPLGICTGLDTLYYQFGYHLEGSGTLQGNTLFDKYCATRLHENKKDQKVIQIIWGIPYLLSAMIGHCFSHVGMFQISCSTS